MLHCAVTHKSQKIAEWTADLHHNSLDPRYLGFFRLFNQQRFFEAHEVLEDLWLEDRSSSDFHFYKGLIQLAGAFVHFQKGRAQPAAALLRLAAENLARYPDRHQQLQIAEVRDLLDLWLKRAQSFQKIEIAPWPPPILHLESGPAGVKSPSA